MLERDVREVRAGDQEDEQGGTEQENHGPAHIGGHGVAQGKSVARRSELIVGYSASRREEMLARSAARRLEGHAGPDARDAVVHVLLARDRGARDVVADVERNPERLVATEGEAARHDPDDIVRLLLYSVMVRPTMVVSAPSCVSQNPYDRITRASVAGVPSSLENVRPRHATTPSTSNIFAVTLVMVAICGSELPDRQVAMRVK